jgi:Flp pilus assembly protein TadG
MKKKTGKDFNWRNGNGEILGFAVCVFLLTALMVTVSAFMNYSIKSQQLTAAAYAVGRAAVVSRDENLADSRAYAVLQTVYGSGRASREASDEPDHAWYGIEYQGEWKTGKIATVTVSQRLGSIFPLREQTVTRSIAMMIEDSR